jgi:hypothetical protein
MLLFDSIKDFHALSWRVKAFEAVKGWATVLASVLGLDGIASPDGWTQEVVDDGLRIPRQFGPADSEEVTDHGVACALMALGVCAHVLRGQEWVSAGGDLKFGQKSEDIFRRQAAYLLVNAGECRERPDECLPGTLRIAFPSVAATWLGQAQPPPPGFVDEEWSSFLLYQISLREDSKVERHYAELAVSVGTMLEE